MGSAVCLPLLTWRSPNPQSSRHQHVLAAFHFSHRHLQPGSDRLTGSGRLSVFNVVVLQCRASVKVHRCLEKLVKGGIRPECVQWHQVAEDRSDWWPTPVIDELLLACIVSWGHYFSLIRMTVVPEQMIVVCLCLRCCSSKRLHVFLVSYRRWCRYPGHLFSILRSIISAPTGAFVVLRVTSTLWWVTEPTAFRCEMLLGPFSLQMSSHLWWKDGCKHWRLTWMLAGAIITTMFIYLQQVK